MPQGRPRVLQLSQINKHIFLKKRKRTHQVKVEAETGVIHQQAKNDKDCWPSPKARKDREGFLLRAFS